MKKLFLLTAALLPCLLAHSQEAETSDRYADFTIIPRVDLSPTLSSSAREREWELGFGNTSLYTLFEGSMSKHFSWMIANHWFQAGEDLDWPFSNLGRSDSTNWIDYCLANFSFGNLTFSLGKDMIATGGFEFDEWDWDAYTDLSSPLFNSLSCYQWGGSVSYLALAKTTELLLQVTTSPYGRNPFSSNLWAYSFKWTGEYGFLSLIASASALEYRTNQYDYLFAVGANLDFTNKLSLTVDWNNDYGFEDSRTMLKGNTIQGKLSYVLSDKFDISLKSWYSVANSTTLNLPDSWAAGAIMQYYPLKNKEKLRVHAYLAYNSDSETVINLGLRYNLALRLFGGR